MGKTRWNIYTLLAGLALVTLVVGGCAPSATTSTTEKISLVLSDYGTPVGVASEATKWFADEVLKRTNGSVSIGITWSQKTLEQADAVRTGTVHMAHLMPFYTPKLFPFVAEGISGPLQMAGNDIGETAKAYAQLWKEFPELEGEFTKQNQKALASWEMTKSEILSNKPISGLAGLKGYKMRATGNPEQWAATGTVLVAMTSADTYDGLSKGVVDGTTGSIDAMVKYKWYEAAKYFYSSGLGVGMAHAITINLDTWQKLPSSVQKVMVAVGEEVEKNYPGWQKTELEKQEKQMKDAGVQFGVLPPEVLEAWRVAAFRPTYERYVAQVEALGYPNARKILDRYAQLVKFDPYKYPIK